MTPTNMQPSMATRARRLRRPVTAWNRLENAWPDRPAGAASDAMSLDMETSSLIGAAPRAAARRRCAPVALVAHVATPLVGLAQLATDLLVRVLGQPHWRDWQTASAIVPRPAQISRTPRACATGGGSGLGAPRRSAARAALPRRDASPRLLLGALGRAVVLVGSVAALALASRSALSFAAFSACFSAARRFASASALSTAGSPAAAAARRLPAGCRAGRRAARWRWRRRARWRVASRPRCARVRRPRR